MGHDISLVLSSNVNGFLHRKLYLYRPRSEGDNRIGSVRPSVRLFVHALPAEPSVISRRVRLIARMRSIGF